MKRIFIIIALLVAWTAPAQAAQAISEMTIKELQYRYYNYSESKKKKNHEDLTVWAQGFLDGWFATYVFEDIVGDVETLDRFYKCSYFSNNNNHGIWIVDRLLTADIETMGDLLITKYIFTIQRLSCGEDMLGTFPRVLQDEEESDTTGGTQTKDTKNRT